METIAIARMRSPGERIRAIRESAGITQSQLAAAARIGRVTGVRIENGEQSPRHRTLVALARALGRPLADILAGQSTVLGGGPRPSGEHRDASCLTTRLPTDRR